MYEGIPCGWDLQPYEHCPRWYCGRQRTGRAEPTILARPSSPTIATSPTTPTNPASPAGPTNPTTSASLPTTSASLPTTPASPTSPTERTSRFSWLVVSLNFSLLYNFHPLAFLPHFIVPFKGRVYVCMRSSLKTTSRTIHEVYSMVYSASIICNG